MSGSSASTPVACRPSVVVTAAVVVAVALLLPARGRAQAPLGSTTIQLLGVRLQVAPGVATPLQVPLNTALPLGTQLTRGDCTTSPAGTCTVLDPATVFGTPLPQVRGHLQGAGVDVDLDPVAVGQPLQLPALAAAGPYTLTDLHLTDAAGATLLPATPSVLPVTALAQIFVSSLSTRQLTLQEETQPQRGKDQPTPWSFPRAPFSWLSRRARGTRLRMAAEHV